MEHKEVLDTIRRLNRADIEEDKKCEAVTRCMEDDAIICRLKRTDFLKIIAWMYQKLKRSGLL